MTTATTIDFAGWSHAQLQRVEAALQRVLPAPEIAPQRLHQAMRYAVLGGGKRVRPLLAFAAGELSAADPDRVALAGPEPKNGCRRNQLNGPATNPRGSSDRRLNQSPETRP